MTDIQFDELAQGTQEGSLGDQLHQPGVESGFPTTPNAVDGGDADEPSILRYEESTNWNLGPQDVPDENLKLMLSSYLHPMIEYPADKLTLATFTVPVTVSPGFTGPILVVNRQVQGMACRLEVRNTGTVPVWLLTDGDSAVVTATGTQVFSQGFVLPQAAGELSVFRKTVRNAIWAACPGATPGQISVSIETYQVEETK